METDTPLTDAECKKASYRFCDAPDANVWIDSEFARELERENARLRDRMRCYAQLLLDEGDTAIHAAIMADLSKRGRNAPNL